MPPFYAHTKEGSDDPGNWQFLEKHLYNVADLASQFASSFSSSTWGHAAGLWHDLGKYQPAFQDRLQGERIAVEHSGSGAGLAVTKDKNLGTILAFIIAGHHTGLANLIESGPGFPTPLLERLKNHDPASLDLFIDHVPAFIRDHPLPALPPFIEQLQQDSQLSKDQKARSREFWIRFLFSALIDADRLDTERFTEPEKAATRGRFDSLSTLRQNLDHFIDDKVATLSTSESNTPVNRARARILSACRTAAVLPPGAFSLTVPTGGGKTLSALSFALRHAEAKDQQRVIVVIPYTSIIEQNVAVYRDALGTENVVEHHSNIDIEKAQKERGIETTLRHDLAAENWDAPVVVTTTVQFFESLFSNRTSRCRKLHNIARSVIVLDEVQALPPEFLYSILDALRELVSHYGCSIVLSTATPPALKQRTGFEFGLENVREIIDNSSALSTDLKRVTYHWPSTDDPPVEWPSLATQLSQHEQVLTIVHKRDDARQLTEVLQNVVSRKSIFHLSALMCPAHRSVVLAQVKNALNNNNPCRLVSTQLIEAGVDVDFPFVYRALGGMDSIVQAAGRCNREGRLSEGHVFIFHAPSAPPSGTPQRALATTQILLNQYGESLDPNDPALFDEYFSKLYSATHPDPRGIQESRKSFNFAIVSKDFRLIEDGFTHTIIVPYKKSANLLADIRKHGIDRHRLRKLQPYLVSIYPKAFEIFLRTGTIESVVENSDLYALSQTHLHLYDEIFGLRQDDSLYADPAALII